MSWTLHDGGRPVEIRWRERGGPRVAPPRRQGFGTQLLEHGLASRFGGTVELVYDPDGLICRIYLPRVPEVMSAVP